MNGRIELAQKENDLGKIKEHIRVLDINLKYHYNFLQNVKDSMLLKNNKFLVVPDHFEIFKIKNFIEDLFKIEFQLRNLKLIINIDKEISSKKIFNDFQRNV